MSRIRLPLYGKILSWFALNLAVLALLSLALLLPLGWRYVSRRMPPEEEAAWREAERRGQGDEWLKKRQMKKRSPRL